MGVAARLENCIRICEQLERDREKTELLIEKSMSGDLLDMYRKSDATEKSNLGRLKERLRNLQSYYKQLEEQQL